MYPEIEQLVDELERDGVGLHLKNGFITWDGPDLSMKASAILIVLERHFDELEVVLANRNHTWPGP